MPISVARQSRTIPSTRLATFALLMLGCMTSFAQSATTPTTINIDEAARLTNAKRLGLNLGTQDFYDSGQFMRNLAFRNPGFEAETWQSILHCKYVTATSCTDDNNYAYWPANFFAGATAEFIVGKGTGTHSKVVSNTAANVAAGTGVTVHFDSVSVAPSVGDYLVVRLNVPGHADVGWWTQSNLPGAFSTEYSDLSPHTPGKQALRVTTGANQYATVSNYADSTPGRSFLQMNGTYTITFRAKGTGGANQVEVSVGRAVTAPPAVTFFDKTVTLTNSWQDYSFSFQAHDVNRVGTIGLTFKVYQSSMLIDDATLTASASPDNPTVYRDEVVDTLKNLHPGILRFMDSGTDWGSSFDNMIAPDFARMRAGYNDYSTLAGDIPLSLPDYLVLCKTIGAEPWYTMQAGMTTQEMTNTIEYLAGPASTVYGAKRAAAGQVDPWTTVFPTIHLEFGNEVWNTSNPGALIADAPSYGKRSSAIFTTAKSSPYYSPKSFDLILAGWQALPYWNAAALAASSNYDTLDVAAYIFGEFNDAASTERIYGPMLAEPESISSVAGGLMVQEAATAAAAAHPAKLSVYESNMGTVSGAASQANVNKAIASLGAGLATVDNMLLMLRDLGITDQNMFALPGLTAPYTGLNGSNGTSSPIWGIVVDMGGPTNLLRPTYLAQQLANSAILPTLLSTSQTGSNPTWNQAMTTNDYFSLPNAHYIQSFAFTDGKKLNVILLNLSRTTALPVNFAGLNAPLGAATISTLTASDISASNEAQANVSTTSHPLHLTAGEVLSLPPFSMTVVSVDAPVIPIAVTSVTLSCAKPALSPNDVDACTAKVMGTGAFNSGVTWSATNGKVSSTGVYTADSSVPSSGNTIITATSVGNASKKASFTVLIAPDAITGVTLSCPIRSVAQGGSVSCTGKVSGTGDFTAGIKWSATGGAIDAAGNLTAPSTGTSVTVTAASAQDPTKSAAFTVSLFPALVIGSPSSVTTPVAATVNVTTNMPAHSGLSYGTTQRYELGTTSYVPTASTSASFSLANLKPSTLYYVLIFSITNTQTVYKAYTFTTMPPDSITAVSVSCPANNIATGGTMTCSSQVTGVGGFSKSVTWSTTAGSITAAGVLTASATGSTLTIRATSVGNPAKFGEFPVALNAGLAITSVTSSVTSTTATVSWATGLPTHSGISYGTTTHYGSGTTPFAPQMTSSPSITLSGLAPGTTYYLLLFSFNDTQTVTKAITVTTAAQSANAVSAITVGCPSASLVPGATMLCTATVTGTGTYSKALIWSTTGGTISTTGAVTAPVTGTAITIRATSATDATKFGSLTLTLGAKLAINSVAATVTATTATINWSTISSSHSGISFGETLHYEGGTTPFVNQMTASPSITLTGLKPGTLYDLLLFSFNDQQTVMKAVTVTTALK